MPLLTFLCMFLYHVIGASASSNGLPRSLLRAWIIYQLYFSTPVLCQDPVTSNITSSTSTATTTSTTSITTTTTTTTSSSSQASQARPVEPVLIFTTANPPDLQESSGQSDPDLYPIEETQDQSTTTPSQPLGELNPQLTPGTIPDQSSNSSIGTSTDPDLGSGESDRGVLTPENGTQLAPADVERLTGPDTNDSLISTPTIPTTDNSSLFTDSVVASSTSTTEVPAVLIVTELSQSNLTEARTLETTIVSESSGFVTDTAANTTSDLLLTFSTVPVTSLENNTTPVSEFTPEVSSVANVTSQPGVRVSSEGAFLPDTNDTSRNISTVSQLNSTTVSSLTNPTMSESSTTFESTTMTSTPAMNLSDSTVYSTDITTNATTPSATSPFTSTLRVTTDDTDVITNTTLYNTTTRLPDDITTATTTGGVFNNDTSTLPDAGVTSYNVTALVTDVTGNVTLPVDETGGPGAELWIIIVAAVASVFLVIIIIFIACCIRRKRGEKARKMRYVGDDDNIMDYAYHPRRPASPPTKQNGTTSRASVGMRTSPSRPASEENPVTSGENMIEFDPTTKPAFRNYFQDGLRANDNLDSSSETLDSNQGVPTNPEPGFSHNSMIRRDKNKSFPLQPLDPKKARMSMGPIMLSGTDDIDSDRPSTQKTYDKMYTHSTFKK